MEEKELKLRAQGLLEQLRRWSDTFHGLQAELGTDLRERGVVEAGESTMVDLGFLHRELENELDSLRKESKKRKEQLGRALGVMITKRAVEDPRKGTKATGELATASADVRVFPVLPKKDTPEYIELLEFFGVKGEWVEKRLFSMHWARLRDYLTELHVEGKPAPHHLVSTEQDINVIYRGRRLHGKRDSKE